MNYLMNLLDCKQEKTHCKEVIEVIEVVYSPQVVEVLVRLELEQVLVLLRVKSGKKYILLFRNFFLI